MRYGGNTVSVESRITSLIGTATAAGQRVYDTFVETTPSRPFIIFQEITATPVNTHEAPSTLYQTLIQLSCYGDTMTQATALRAEVIDLLEGNHVEGPIYVESLRAGSEDAVTPKLYRSDADMTVWNED